MSQVPCGKIRGSNTHLTHYLDLRLLSEQHLLLWVKHLYASLKISVCVKITVCQAGEHGGTEVLGSSAFFGGATQQRVS